MSDYNETKSGETLKPAITKSDKLRSMMSPTKIPDLNKLKAAASNVISNVRKDDIATQATVEATPITSSARTETPTLKSQRVEGSGKHIRTEIDEITHKKFKKLMALEDKNVYIGVKWLIDEYVAAHEDRLKGM